MDDLPGKNGVIKKFIKHLTIATVTERADSASRLVEVKEHGVNGITEPWCRRHSNCLCG